MGQQVASLYAEIDAKTDKFDRGLKGAESAMQGAQGKLGKLGSAFEDLTGISAKAALSVGGITAAVGAIGESVRAAAEWGDSMGDLATKTGMTVRQASELAVVFDQVGVNAGTLEAAVRGATQKGIQFNLENLKKLAAEYQAIDDPVRRSQFAIEKFGRAGLEMTEILSRSSDELDGLAQSARMSGKVIDEETAAAAERLNVEMKQLQQMMEGAQIAIGNALVPTLVDAAEGFQNLLLAGGAAALMFAKMSGQITEQEAATRAAALANGDLAAGYMRDWKPSADAATESTTDLTTATDTQTRSAGALAAETERWAGIAAEAAADAALQERLDDLTGAASDLKFSMGELTTATLFHQAAQGLDADAAYALAESMGLIDPQAAAAKEILDGLRAELESGAITTGQYTGAVGLLSDAIGTLPDGKRVTIEYVEQYRQEFNRDTGVRGGTNNSRQGGAIGDGYATGGDFIVPPGYPNDSYPLRVTSGERVTITPASQVTNNYNLNMTTASASLGVRNDFALMRALAGV